MNEDPQDRPGVHLGPDIPPAPDENRPPVGPGTPPENGTPPGYPPPPWPYWEEEQPPVSNGWSIASLVLGILSVVCCCRSVLSLICAVLAIVFAAVSRAKKRTFDGMAIAGLVLGIIGAALSLFSAVLLLGGLIESLLGPPDFYYDDPAFEGGEVLARLLSRFI